LHFSFPPRRAINQRHFSSVFAVVMGVVALLATIRHAVEGMVWAAAYRLLSALPDIQFAASFAV
jgi:hypothetical protein